MQENDHRLSELLQRYLNGECRPEEERFVEDWYNSLGSDRKPLPLGREETAELQSRLWRSIRSRSSALPAGRKTAKSFRNRRWMIYLPGSAAALLLLFVVLVNRKGGEDPGKYARSGPVPAVYQKTNNSSRTILVVLQDESMVWLKPSGSIRYTDFSRSSRREVVLSGEAYFEVAKKPEKPFLVRSGNVVTRVTGTKFNVKAYKEDKTVEVEVTEGTVEVSRKAGKESELSIQAAGSDPALKLTARQKAVYHTGSRKLEKLSIVSSRLHPVEKISQELAFEFSDTPLRKVIDLLEEAYPVSIELENKALEDCPLTASLNNETLDIKLELICRSIGASFHKSPGRITIAGEGCTP